jgi:hypothetical protein
MEDLRRFWFPCEPGEGIGVTATSLEDARELAESVLVYLPGSTITGAVEDVDVDTLDQHLILPNLGPTHLYGVWYPMLNV